MPAVRLNRPASDGEAQPHTAFFPGAAGVDAIEAIENTMVMLLSNSRPIVSYLDHCLPRRFRTQFDTDRAVIRRVFYRIMNEIHEGMTHECSVPLGMNWKRSAKREILMFFVGKHAKLINDVSSQCSEVQGLQDWLHPSRVGPRKGQKTLDEAREPIDFLQHAADDVAVRARLRDIIDWILAAIAV